MMRLNKSLLLSTCRTLRIRTFAYRTASTSTDTEPIAGSVSRSDSDIESLLRFTADGVSKAPLRYDAEAGLLINDERGVAYPLVDGIPRLIPSEEQPYPAKL